MRYLIQGKSQIASGVIRGETKYDNITGIITEHGDEYLPWKTTPWGEFLSKRTEDVFGEVNSFLDKLPASHHDDLWKLFAKASSVIVSYTDRNERDREIRDIITSIMGYIPKEKVDEHLRECRIPYEPDMTVVKPPLTAFIDGYVRGSTNPFLKGMEDRIEMVRASGEKIHLDYAMVNAAITAVGDNYSASAKSLNIPVKLMCELNDLYANPVYPKVQTYDEYEYAELLAVVFYFKIFAPIIGNYTEAVRDEVTTSHKEMKIFEVFMETPVADLPAMEKLYSYCEAWATGKSGPKHSPYTLGISTDDIPMYYMCMTCINRMPQSILSDKTSTFITYMYRFIKNRGDEVNKGAPKDKDAGRQRDDENDGITEQYRISERFPANIPKGQTIALWGRDDEPEDICRGRALEFVRRAFKEEPDQELFFKYLDVIRNRTDYKKSTFHPPIMKLVIGHAIFVETMPNTSRNAYISAAAATAYGLDKLGFKDIALLMTARRIERPDDEYQVGGIHLNQLSSENDSALRQAYKYVYRRPIQKQTYGHNFITATVKVINTYDWEGLEPAQISDIRNSFARLLLLNQ